MKTREQNPGEVFSIVHNILIKSSNPDNCSDLARTNMLYFTTPDTPLSSCIAPSKAENITLNDNLCLDVIPVRLTHVYICIDLLTLLLGSRFTASLNDRMYPGPTTFNPFQKQICPVHLATSQLKALIPFRSRTYYRTQTSLEAV